jgi:hypothetical protein
MSRLFKTILVVLGIFMIIPALVNTLKWYSPSMELHWNSMDPIISQQDNVGTIKITGTVTHSFIDHQMIPVNICGGRKAWLPCAPSIYKDAVEANSWIEKFGYTGFGRTGIVEVTIEAKPRPWFWFWSGDQQLWITGFHKVVFHNTTPPTPRVNPAPHKVIPGGGFRKVYRGGNGSGNSYSTNDPETSNVVTCMPQAPVAPQNIIHIENDGDGNVYNITIGDDKKTISGNKVLTEPTLPPTSKDTLHSGIPTVSL